MAEKEFNKVRVQSLYDTYSNWTTKNPILKKGEIAIVEVPAETGAATTEPTLLVKVGNGTSRFNALGWTSALAADVYSWAKSATKPAYTASEVGADAAGAADAVKGSSNDTSDKITVYGTRALVSNKQDKLISYTVTLAPASWTASGSQFKYTYSNTSLRATISPIITCTSNTSEYGYITEAEATTKTGISFTARKKPTANIVLTIIDMG